jgi:hypothetical protein
VADLAPARRAEAADLAHRIGREVVVQHEVGARVGVQRVDDLLVLAGAQRGDHQRLGLAAGEQRRAMRARQHADFGDDRADGRTVAPVDAGAAADDVAAQDRRFELLEGSAQRLVGLVLLGKLRAHRLAGGRDGRGPLLLVADGEGGAHLRLAQALDPVIKRRIVRRGEIERLARGILGQIDDQVEDRPDRLVAEPHRAQHLLLGQLIGLRFNHHHRVPGAGDHQIEPLLGVLAQLLHVLDIGVEHVFAIDIAHARRRDRTHEGHARDGQRRRGGNHRHHIGLVDQIVAEHGADHQNLVVEARREQRPDRPVDQPRGQHLLLGRPRLALEKAAGHLAGGVVALLVMYRERQEIHPRLRLLGEGHVGHDARIAQRGNDRAVGLTGHPARLEGERLLTPLHRFFRDVEHSAYPLGSIPGPCRAPVQMAAPLPPTPILRITPGPGRHVSDARGITAKEQA